MGTIYMQEPSEVRKGLSGPLELKSQMVVSYHLVTKPRPSERALSHLSSPHKPHF